MKRVPAPAPANEMAATSAPARSARGRAAELAGSPRQQRQRAVAEQMQQGRRGPDVRHKELALLNAELADEEQRRRKRRLKEKQKPR